MAESAGGTAVQEKKLVRCPVFRIDLKGRFVNVDDLTEKFFGYPSEYYFGKNISEFLDESSQLIVEEILSTGRHFETFFKSVNLSFVDANRNTNDVGAVISLNFIGGNPANYQFILTSAFPAQLGDMIAEEEAESDLERIARSLFDLGGEIDWNGFAKTVCTGENVLYGAFYVYDEGSLSILGEAFRPGSESGVEPSGEDQRHIDVASKRQPLIPGGENSGDNFEYCFPLICRDRAWGILRLYTDLSDQDIFDRYNTISGILGGSLYPYIRDRWDQKQRHELLTGSFWSQLHDLNCTCLSFNREGKLSKQYCRFIGDDNALSASDTVHQALNPETGIRIKDHLTDDCLRFSVENGELEIPKEAFVLHRGEIRLMKIVPVPKEAADEAEYVALIFTGIRADNVGKDDLKLIDSIISNASVFIEAVNKNAVLLSANSYRQLGKDGRSRLNSIQDQCKAHNESLKRIKAQLQLLNRQPVRTNIDLARLVERSSLAADIPGREKPLYEFGKTDGFESDSEIIEEAVRSIFANIVSSGFPKDNPPVRINVHRHDNTVEMSFACRADTSGDNYALPFYMKINGAENAAPGLEYNVLSRLLKSLGGSLEINREPDGYTIRLKIVV